MQTFKPMFVLVVVGGGGNCIPSGFSRCVRLLQLCAPHGFQIKSNPSKVVTQPRRVAALHEAHRCLVGLLGQREGA